jgi:hypothetical protein
MRSSERGDPIYDVNFVNFVGFRGRMKPINVWPLLILLIAVVLIVIWLRPH